MDIFRNLRSLPRLNRLVLFIGLIGIATGAIGINLADDIPWIRFFDNLHWTAGTVAAAIFVGLSLRRTVPELRKTRAGFFIGLTAFAIGQVLWDIQIAIGYLAFPGPADFFYLLLGPCIAYSLLHELFRTAETNQRLCALLDAATLAVATIAFVLALYLPERGNMGFLPLVVLIAYPVTLLSASCIALVLTFTLQLRLTWQWLISLVSLTAIGMFWMNWNLLVLDNSPRDGSWLNVLWSLVMLAVGIGLGLWQGEKSSNQQYLRICEGLIRLFPILSVTLACLALLLASQLDNVPPGIVSLAQIAAPLVILLAMIRQVLLLKERDMLFEAQAALVREQEAVRVSEERFRTLILATSQMVWVTNAQGEVVEDIPLWRAYTGQTVQEVKGSGWVHAVHPDDRARILQTWQKCLAARAPYEATYQVRRHDGVYCHFIVRAAPVFASDGTVREWMGACTDITELKKSEEVIWRQANFDALTGLPNRHMLLNRLEQEFKKSDRVGLPLAFLLIDLDQFKEINDTLGHEVGDALLQQAAKRICDCVRGVDTVARLGGDEFVVIVSDLTDRIQAEEVAQKIITRMADPYHLGNETAFVSASIGITLYPNDTTDISHLMKNADQAMYVAKSKGRNCFSYFTKGLQESAHTRMQLTNDMRRALADDQFIVYYQPIVELSSGHIHKAEALLRWQHPVRGMIFPGVFIPLAETSGLINEIGDWVFKKSVDWLSAWNKRGRGKFQVSVNMSPVQFHARQNLIPSWTGYLNAAGLAGGSIVLEITEGLLLNAEQKVMDQLILFRDIGIEVSIDDFGTGYSALSYLKKFHIDYLKIDQSFVKNMETDTDDVALCEAIIVMAHKLGLAVIAEGVETEGQKNLLLAMGCDYGQGYWFAHPMPETEFVKFLEKM